MRNILLSLYGMILLAAAVLAQNAPGPKPAPALDPANNKLDEILVKWEKAMTGLESLWAQCKRTTLDKVFESSEVFEGTAKFVKSGVGGLPARASLELRHTKDPNNFEKYICTGNFMYAYVPGNKVIRIYELPPPKPGQLGDDNVLSFVFGMKAADAKARYKITHVPEPKQAQWYYYLKIEPILLEDKRDFSEARLTLNSSTFLPRQVWFQSPNNNEVTWDFPKVVKDAPIPLAEFARPSLPAGWQWEKVPVENKARVVRQNQ